MEKINNTPNRITGKTHNEMLGKNVWGIDRVHKGNKSLGHRKWQGGRHKKKVFKKGDTGNHLVKKASRDKRVLVKSYESGNWSAPVVIEKKSGN